MALEFVVEVRLELAVVVEHQYACFISVVVSTHLSLPSMRFDNLFLLLYLALLLNLGQIILERALLLVKDGFGSDLDLTTGFFVLVLNLLLDIRVVLLE